MSTFGSPTRREPALNIPGLLVAVIVALVAIQAARGWLDPETDLRLLLELSFIPAPWSVASGLADAEDVLRAAEQAGRDGPGGALRAELARYVLARGPPPPWALLSYAALHGSWAHVLLNSVWLVAFGTPLVKRAGPARSVLLGLVTAVAGALAQWLSDPLGLQLTIGASAVVSGFMAATATFIFSRQSAPGAGMWSFLTNRNVIVFLAVWLAANLLFGWIAVPLGIADGAIAWQAHIGGFLAGLLLFPFIDPAGPFSLRAARAA